MATCRGHDGHDERLFVHFEARQHADNPGHDLDHDLYHDLDRDLSYVCAVVDFVFVLVLAAQQGKAGVVVVIVVV